jgi:hypothetical protein
LQKFVCGLRLLLLYQLILAGAGCYLFVIQVLRSMLASDTFLSWAIDIVEHTLLVIYSVVHASPKMPISNAQQTSWFACLIIISLQSCTKFFCFMLLLYQVEDGVSGCSPNEFQYWSLRAFNHRYKTQCNKWMHHAKSDDQQREQGRYYTLH